MHMTLYTLLFSEGLKLCTCILFSSAGIEANCLDFSGEPKISNFEKFVICNEHITAGQITMDNVQTSKVLL